jgi:hypothetical protein
MGKQRSDGQDIGTAKETLKDTAKETSAHGQHQPIRKRKNDS